jgi:hypothetical protein
MMAALILDKIWHTLFLMLPTEISDACRISATGI